MFAPFGLRKPDLFSVSDILRAVGRSPRHAPPPPKNGYPLTWEGWGETWSARAPDDWSDGPIPSTVAEVQAVFIDGGPAAYRRILSPDSFERLIARDVGNESNALHPLELGLGRAAAAWYRSQAGVDAVFHDITAR